MFKNLVKAIEKLNLISIPIESDASGFIDKQCPDEECLFYFKVFSEDWIQKFSNDKVFCPMCGHSDRSTKWWPTNQLEHLKKEALKQVKHSFSKALQSDARKFNANQVNNKSFIQIHMKVEGQIFKPMIIPVKCRDIFEKKIICSECSAVFAVVGSAFFCPCCGINNIEDIFNDSIENTRLKLQKIDEITEIFRREGLKDQSVNISREILESSIIDIVSSFQSYAERMFLKRKTDLKLRKNLFQNLDEGSKMFKKIYDFSYLDVITEDQFRKLKILFNTRHLFVHNSGIVDESYIIKTGEDSKKIGQRIIVKRVDVNFMIKMISTLADALRTKCSKS